MKRICNVRKREFNYSENKPSERLKRIFKLLVFMSEFRTLDECAKYLGVSKKTIGRMINQLHSIGFEFETNYSRYYATRIVNIERFFSGQI